MAIMPVPNGLTLFIMAGSEAAELAGTIVTSVQDHMDADSQHAVSCFALVGDAFDEEKAVVDHVFYRYTPETLKATAAQTAIDKLDHMNVVLGQEGITHYNLKRANCVLVASADGSMPFDQVAEIEQAIREELSHSSIACDFFLCLLTDYRHTSEQHAWLMRNAHVHPAMKAFEKVLLLSNKDHGGSLGARIEQNMRDAVVPALLMMLNGHELNDQTRLYTAAYSKMGGTSNDILELKRHIAAEVLDGYFANPNSASAADVWEFLSTDEMQLTIGKTVLERVQAAAESYLPSLECIAATADLEDKFFDPVAQIMTFDAMNRVSMCDYGALAERWENDMLAKIPECLYLDALLAYLEDESELFSSILSEYWSVCQNYKAMLDEKLIVTRINCAEKKKGLLTKRTDYNLQLLSMAVVNYHHLCRDRYAYRILSCLQEKIPTVRENIRNLIHLRKEVLTPYKQPENKIAVLVDENMCGRAAKRLRSYFSGTDLVQKLPTFLKYSNRLYQDGCAKYWRSLYREFVNSCKITESFSQAFLAGKDPEGLLKGVKQLTQTVHPLIPEYPDELGALPVPSGNYLLNEQIADHITGASILCYSVPGDVLEHMALYRLGEDYTILEKFKLFSQGLYHADIRHSSALGKKKSSSVKQVIETSDYNPWSMRLKETPSGVQLSWRFDDTKAIFDIMINDELVEAHYDYKTFTKNGMVYTIPAEYVHGNHIKVTLASDDEFHEIELALERRKCSASLTPLRTKTKAMELELVRYTGECAEGLTGKCIVMQQGAQSFRMPVPLNPQHDIIDPLWLPEGYDELMLEEID